MCCGIKGQDTADPVFVRLESIDVSSHVEFSRQEDTYFEDPAKHSQLLSQILEPLHETCFANLDTQPGWKVIVMLPDNETIISQIDVLFVWHHGFFDGLSGRVFHQRFLKELNQALDGVETEEEFTLSVPQVLDIPPAFEDAMDFPVTWTYRLYQFWQNYMPKWISGFLTDSPVSGVAASK